MATVRSGCMKYRELLSIFSCRVFLLSTKAKVFNACVRSGFPYGRKKVAVKRELGELRTGWHENDLLHLWWDSARPETI